MKSRGTSLFVVAACYAVAASAGGWVLHAGWLANDVAALFAADFAATVVIFVASAVANNSSLYDPYWSVAPPLSAAWLMARAGVVSWRGWLVEGIILFWAIRLTYNWVRGWPGLHHEDWRYMNIRKTTGRAYWLVSFFGLHLFPTVMVFLGCLCLFPALAAGGRPLGVLDGVAFVVGIAAVLLELIADEQLRAFRAQPSNAGQAIERGVWRVSRHPNYLGEIGFWFALALFGYSAAPVWWVFGGALAIMGMFVFASIPMMEKRTLLRRPNYAARMKRTRMLLVWPARRS